MGTPRLDAAKAYAQQLSAATGLVVTVDPAEAVANLPAVLILPPRISAETLDGTILALGWRLAALTTAPGNVDAWQELDGLLDALLPLINAQDAEPATYTVSPDVDPLPAYLITAAD